MAGLLDNYGTDPLNQGLLNLGVALMTPRAAGGGVANGLLAFNAGAMQAQQYRRALEQDARRNKLIDAQVARFSADAEKDKAELEAKKAALARQQEFYKLLGGGPDAVLAQTGNLSPTNTNAALLNQPVRITPQIAAAAMAAGVKLDDLKAMAESGDWGRRKVAGTVETTDAQGRPVYRMRDDFGDFIGDAMPKPYEKKFQDFGGSIGVVDPYTLAQSGSFTKTMTPGDVQAAKDAAAGRGVTIRGQNMADARARAQLDWEKSKPAEGARPPSGFRYKPDGSLEFIPGGPADPATQKAGNPTEDENRSAGLAVRMENALKTLEEVTKQTPSAASPTFFQRFAGNVSSDLENAISPEARQRVTAAQLDALDAALTLATGAAYTKEQLAGLSRSYFPQYRDDPQTIADKQERFRKVIETAKIRAGRAAGNIPRLMGTAPNTDNDPLGLRGGL